MRKNVFDYPARCPISHGSQADYHLPCGLTETYFKRQPVEIDWILGLSHMSASSESLYVVASILTAWTALKTFPYRWQWTRASRSIRPLNRQIVQLSPTESPSLTASFCNGWCNFSTLNGAPHQPYKLRQTNGYTEHMNQTIKQLLFHVHSQFEWHVGLDHNVN